MGVRIGGKGTVRRKKKVVHRTATTDDKKLQSSLKKLSVNNIPGIEEVNMIKDDGTVIHFNNPKVQASLAANTFAVTGHAENKQITAMLAVLASAAPWRLPITWRKKMMMRSPTLLRTLMRFPRTRLPQRMRKFQKFQLTSLRRPRRRSRRSKKACGSCFGHSRK